MRGLVCWAGRRYTARRVLEDWGLRSGVFVEGGRDLVVINGGRGAVEPIGFRREDLGISREDWGWQGSEGADISQ